MEQKTGKAGRPKGPVAREKQMCLFLTEADAEFLSDFARSYGFKSRSEVMTFCMERLIEGGFSGLSGLKLCKAIQRQCEEANPEKWKQAPLDFGQLRPSPAIPDEFLTKEDLVAEIESISAHLQKGVL